ncbi:MAG: sugar isomerase [Candidatus Hydrogenedentota bacterium]
MNRRTFLGTGAAMAAATSMTGKASRAASAQEPWPEDWWNPEKPYGLSAKPLRVQPVLMYRVAEPRPQASYKSWGGVQSHEAATREAGRIEEELGKIAAEAPFEMQVLPVVKITSPDELAKVDQTRIDATVLYPASGGGNLLQAGMDLPNPVIFVRHRSGPVYYWYEALSVRYLRTDRPDYEAVREGPTPELSVHDVVVDELAELAWRLRVLHAVHNTLGARVVALGGVWGKYAPEAPRKARDQYGMELIEVSYDDFASRLDAAFADPKKMQCAENWTDRYLAMANTSLETDRPFVVNAFVLYGLFKELMSENNAGAFTIRDCMGAIMPLSNTTACLTLSLMNDEGTLALCESDFVIVPPAVFLYHLCRTPVFMHNSTFPHEGVVTCAHCTGPRRMDGIRYEPARILTHYESEYGAAPKVEMPLGTTVSFLDPEYAVGRWVGIRGEVIDNPFFEICRSQQDVRIEGDWKRLLHEVRDSHWLMVYGDYLREMGYAANRLGVAWDNISDA